MSDENEPKYPWRLFRLGFPIAKALKYSYGSGVTAACSSMGCTCILLRALNRGMRNERSFMMAAFDSLIFDSLASIFIPSFITYHVCRLAYKVFYENGSPPGTILWEPTIAGLAVLCLTVDPVDKLVNDAMDNTIRANSDN